MNKNYSNDAPIDLPNQDRFNRWPFAKRISQVIAIRQDPSSLILGIYGAWGQGKTSVLNLIEHQLAEYENLICYRFNPWRFGDEEQLLQGFFFELAGLLGRSLTTQEENIGEIVKTYGMPIAGIFGMEGTVDSGVDAALGKGPSLKEFRDRLEKIMIEEETRVVILVDDIDRLDKDEIFAVFRLVKLTADLKNTAYILSFDDEMVAAVLQERYGGSAINSGRAFLEKIIQVPLQLPAVELTTLREYCFKGVNQGIERGKYRAH